MAVKITATFKNDEIIATNLKKYYSLKLKTKTFKINSTKEIIKKKKNIPQHSPNEFVIDEYATSSENMVNQ